MPFHVNYHELKRVLVQQKMQVNNCLKVMQLIDQTNHNNICEIHYILRKCMTGQIEKARGPPCQSPTPEQQPRLPYGSPYSIPLLAAAYILICIIHYCSTYFQFHVPNRFMFSKVLQTTFNFSLHSESKIYIIMSLVQPLNRSLKQYFVSVFSDVFKKKIVKCRRSRPGPIGPVPKYASGMMVHNLFTDNFPDTGEHKQMYTLRTANDALEQFFSHQSLFFCLRNR
ncbi:hypothetical protein AGLY_002759 [Aphis glycines]|uniref:Uncharacterized protein n=1 Tax=Aphis glycines TaxID=307491 RepID=A0A6G0U156_APHGL|nr:hypothetical protein AGLY_002759 [Aphis glycines]